MRGDSSREKSGSSLPLLGTLRPNASVNIVKEAKASLQNPSRPFTPGDGGRRLFSDNEYTNRPPTAGLMPKRPGVGSAADWFAPASGSGSDSVQPLPPLGLGLTNTSVATSRTNLPPIQRLNLKSGVDESDLAARALASSAAPTSQTLSLTHDSADLQRPPTAAAGPSALHRYRRVNSNNDAMSIDSHGIPPTHPQASGNSFTSMLMPRGSSAKSSSHPQTPLGDETSNPMASAPLPPRPSSRTTAAAQSTASLVATMQQLQVNRPGSEFGGSAAGSVGERSSRPSGSGGSSRPMSSEKSLQPPTISLTPPQHPTMPPAPAPSSMPLIGAAGIPRPPSRNTMRSPGTSDLPSTSGIAIAPPSVDAPFAVPSLATWQDELEGVLVAIGTQEAITPSTGSVTAALQDPNSSISQLNRLVSHLVALVEAGSKQEAQQWDAWLETRSSVYETEDGKALPIRECIEEHADRLMESPALPLSLKGASILLRVLTAPHQAQMLVRTARHIFSCSKDQQADPLFRKEGVLPAVCDLLRQFATAEESGRTDESQFPPLDVVIYLTGALKNTSQDVGNQRALFKLGCGAVTVRLLNVVLRRIESSLAGDEGAAPVDKWAQLAVQITAIMRNLSQSASQARCFSSKNGGYNAVTPLVRLARSLHTHRELVLNITRVLSKLCLVDECLADLGQDDKGEGAKTLFMLMKDYETHPQVLLRSAFVLALATAAHHQARAAFREQSDHVTNTLAGILDRWASGRHDQTLSGSQADDATDANVERAMSSAAATSTQSPAKLKKAGLEKEGGPPPSVLRAELLVKVVRVAANLAIDTTLGPVIAADPRIGTHLVKLLKEFTLEEHEELALNLACAATNLTFYVGPANVLLTRHAADLVDCTLPMLTSLNEEAVVEAARTLGNLSRKQEARAEMVRSRAVEALVLLLDHPHRDVVYSSTGAMVNVLGDPAARESAEATGCAGRLVDVLERSGSAFATSPGGTPQLDWPLAMTVCKALFNFVGEQGSGHLTPAELEQLAGFLAVLPALDGVPRDVASVATRLLDAIQARGADIMCFVDDAKSGSGYGHFDDDDDSQLEPLPFTDHGDDSGFLHDD